MSEQQKPICVDNILVSLDASKHSFSALKAAVELAHHYDAKLYGVFVQDTALLSLAETQFLFEIGEYTAISRKITVDGLTHGMIAQSRWITRAFHKLVEKTGVEGEFIVLHGDVNEVLDEESEKCDLLVIGKSGTHPLTRSRLGSTAKALIQRGRKSILIVEKGAKLGYPMFVFFEDSPLGWISLETAGDLLASDEELTILVEETGAEEFSNSMREIRGWAKEKNVNISFQSFRIGTFGRFVQKIMEQNTGLFIVPFMLKPLYKSLIENYVKEISMPILLVQKPK